MRRKSKFASSLRSSVVKVLAGHIRPSRLTETSGLVAGSDAAYGARVGGQTEEPRGAPSYYSKCGINCPDEKLVSVDQLDQSVSRRARRVPEMLQMQYGPWPLKSGRN